MPVSTCKVDQSTSPDRLIRYSRWPVLPATRIAPRTPSAGGAGAPGTALAETTWAVEAAAPGATLAFALQKEGWYLRADIIWNKPNCQPESVKDRPTRSHEYIFLFSKSEHYRYAPAAVRGPTFEPSGTSTLKLIPRRISPRSRQRWSSLASS